MVPGAYTAIVYFHGIGNQRRHQELSRLVDALDRHSYLSEPTSGRLGGIRGTYETSRVPDRPDIPYVEVVHRIPEGGGFKKTPFRFYEGYWASLNTDAYSGMELIKWALAHGFRPLRPVFGSWRNEPRLRRTALHRLLAQTGAESVAKEAKPLLKAYDRFERADSRRDYPKGTFGDFIAYLEAERPTAITLARRWRRHFFAAQIKAFAIALTLVAAVAVVSLALVFGVLQVLELLSSSELVDPDTGLGQFAEPSWGNAAAVAGTLAAMFGLTRFASRYLGDVVAWSSYHETEPRHRIRSEVLSEAVDLYRHILRDDNCKRLVVVGHSLGSTIAYDALLTLGHQHLAAGAQGEERTGDLLKFDHLFTLGSPIDLLHSFAESHGSKHHRYTRLVEGLRGDIGSTPFSPPQARRKPHMHWINIWDRADVISTPLFSPNQKQKSAPPVDNVEISSMAFPDPASSHVAYFENTTTIALLFESIFQQHHSYHDLTRIVQLGKPIPRRRLLWGQGVMLSIPWLAGLLFIATALRAPNSVTVTLTVALAFTALVTLAGLGVARRVGPKARSVNPISQD